MKTLTLDTGEKLEIVGYGDPARFAEHAETFTTIAVRPIPPKETSLEEEVKEEANKGDNNSGRNYLPSYGLMAYCELQILYEVLDRRLEELEGRIK